ncbi:MAG: AraC family transcriptional regulator [Erysipelotrichaceae bacterium]|nr:AraC family transcriptional regulator [Erysipelotrichaceae bacterium]
MVAKLIDVSSISGLSIHECGREVCIPNKIFSFDEKDYYLVHYVVDGAGTLHLNGRDYNLKRGDMFFFAPHEKPVYHPSPTNPWTYIWVGFSGDVAEEILKLSGINKENAIYTDKDKTLIPFFEQVYKYYSEAGALDLRALGIFYVILGSLEAREDEFSKLPLPLRKVQAGVEYIENNFQHKVSVQDIADNVGITPNYLSAIFVEHLGLSPKQYLTNLKMEKAIDLLLNNNDPIKDIAKAVGYDNALHFSGEFKKHTGQSPSIYREERR